MAIAGILTFYGLLIAAYSILKKHEKLLIMLRLSLLDKILFWALMIVTFFCILASDYFRDFPEKIVLFDCEFQYSFLLVSFPFIMLFLLFAYLGTKIKFNRLRRSKTEFFRNLTVELLNKKEYSELIALLEKEYKRLIKYANSLSFRNSIKDRLLKFFSLKPLLKLKPEQIEELRKSIQKYEELRGKETNQTKEQPKRNKIKLIADTINKELKHHGGKVIRIFFQEVKDRDQHIARDLLHLVLTNREFLSKLIEYKPELGLNILAYRYKAGEDFIDLFFYELIRKKNSILYYEVKNNQNLSYLNRYFINEENKIITYLFKDCEVAKDLAVYQGIGNYVRDYLEDLNKIENDPYNFGYENFDETRWNSPIFLGIRFFDIMIAECIHQGIEWHMWLYSLRVFTERVLKNFKVIPIVWAEHHEWNSKYAYLLYEIVSTLRRWINVISYPEFKYKVSLKNEDCSHENDNIIKSSIMCLIQVLDEIADNDEVPDRFKVYLMDIALTLLFDLRMSDADEAAKYSNVLWSCLKAHLKRYKRINLKFLNLLKLAYDKFDKIPYRIDLGTESTKELDEAITRYLAKLESSL